MENQQSPSYPPRRQGVPVLKIIATILLVLVLICGGLVTYVVYSFPKWASSLARGPLVTMVDQTELPAEQKTRIKQNLNRLADAFKQRRLSFTQFTSVLDKLNNGPFFELIQVEAMQHQYAIAHPAMDAERRDTMLLFERFERGIVEQTIPRDQVMNVLTLVHDPDQPHADKSNTVTEADLRPLIEAMRQAVKQAGIPAEPFEPDFAAEIDRAVTAVLGPDATATAPAQTLPAESPASLPE